jgi:hypothetical protein
MGKGKIPGPLERRHLIERELDAAHAKRIADAYLAEGREVEAVDFLEKAGAEEELEALRNAARARGDVFLLRAASTALGVEVEHGDWQELAEAAAAAGMDRYASEARRQAERGED